MSRRTRIVIVDDHPLLRQGLRQMIDADPRFECVAEAGTAAEGQAQVERLSPDVLVLDVNLPDLSGLEVAKRMRSAKRRPGIVILTMHKEEETFNAALDLGVLGFVLKENAAQDILDCLAAVADGRHYLSPTISGFLVHRRSRAAELAARTPGLEDLTRAERRVLRLIAENKTSRQIAEELFVSPRTVEAHRSNICSKLNLKGTHTLLRFALEHRSRLE